MDPTIAAITAAAVGGLITYLVAARQFSGRIESSEARELWQESRSIREWSAARITRLEEENAVLREEVTHSRERIATLEAKLAELEAKNRRGNERER